MLGDMLNCPRHVTTHRYYYRGEKLPFPAEQLKRDQPDVQLISMHNSHNLQINGHKLKSQVFPESALGVEEYRSFLKRLEYCKKQIFRLYYKCPDVNEALIERLLKEMELSTYQYSYSPNEYYPRDDRRYLAKLPKVNLKYYETIYGIYYNRIKELEHFLIKSYYTLPEKDQAALMHEMNRFYLCGYTTYYNSYCIPIQENMKKFALKDSPIDRYTLRRW